MTGGTLLCRWDKGSIFGLDSWKEITLWKR